MINLAVTGTRGRMGQLLVQAIQADPDVQLSAEVNRLDISNNLQGIEAPVDVLIDFTRPEVVLTLLPVCCQRHYRLVIGTTGLDEKQKHEIQQAAHHIPIILSPNMSVGMNVTYKLLELAAKTLEDQADTAIFEIHHKHKKDSPSGTALRMGEVIAKEQGKLFTEANIAFSALRLGDTIGEHSAIFALEGERIDITHRATNRALFATGAIKAAKWLMNKGPGLYDMQDVLGLRTY